MHYPIEVIIPASDVGERGEVLFLDEGAVILAGFGWRFEGGVGGIDIVTGLEVTV